MRAGRLFPLRLVEEPSLGGARAGGAPAGWGSAARREGPYSLPAGGGSASVRCGPLPWPVRRGWRLFFPCPSLHCIEVSATGGRASRLLHPCTRKIDEEHDDTAESWRTARRQARGGRHWGAPAAPSSTCTTTGERGERDKQQPAPRWLVAAHPLSRRGSASDTVEERPLSSAAQGRGWDRRDEVSEARPSQRAPSPARRGEDGVLRLVRLCLRTRRPLSPLRRRHAPPPPPLAGRRGMAGRSLGAMPAGRVVGPQQGPRSLSIPPDLEHAGG
jgi:hypothetical protein